MTYLHKLAQRLSRIKPHILGAIAALASCSPSATQQMAGSNPQDGSTSGAASLSVSPQSMTIDPGDSLHLFAWLHDAAGDSVTAAVTWVASDGAMIDSAGWFIGGPGGSYHVRAALRSDPALHDSSTVAVRPGQALSELGLSPTSVTVDAGATWQFTTDVQTVVGFIPEVGYVNVPVTWSATGGMVTATGLFTAGQQGGTYRVIATLPDGGPADTATVVVVSPMVRVTVSPGSFTIAPGGSQPLVLMATLGDGSQQVVAGQWSATGGSIAANTYTAGQTAGQFRVIGSYQVPGGPLLADTAQVQIVASAATLVRIILDPTQATVTAGMTQQFTATGVWSDSSTATPAVTWAATGGTINTAGLFTAGASAGTWHVTATQQGGSVTGSSQVTVIPPRVTALSVAPKSSTLQIGGTVEYSTSATWSDGQSHPYTVGYSATGGTITSGGMYSATSAGTFLIIATCTCGLADTAHATVQPPVLTQLTIAPKSATVQESGTQQFSVTGTWSDGSHTTPAVTWSATGGTISTAGLFTAGATPGTYRVIATQQAGSRADTSTITITLPPVATIAMLSAPASLFTGDSVQLSVMLKDAAGNILTGRSITWASDAPGVAAVSTAGLVTALAPGTATIMATTEGHTGTASLTVTTPTLRQLAAARGFLMGAAAITSAFISDAQYRQVLAAQYNSMVPGNELKFGYLHPGPTLYYFTDADRLVSFAQANGMVIHGTTLIWDVGVPAWVTAGGYTKAQLLAVMKDHITTVVGRYRGKIASWDVVNEPISWNGASGLEPSIWLSTIGPEYIDSAFVWAHAADPSAKLYLNDYAQELFPAKADAIMTLVQGLRSRGVPVDGVGFQSHLYDPVPDAAVFQALYARFANAGFDIRVSELDDRVPDTAPASALDAEAVAYRNVLDACLRVSRCTGITTWGFTDRYSFIPTSHPGFGRGLPFDLNYQSKPAFDSLVARLRRP